MYSSIHTYTEHDFADDTNTARRVTSHEHASHASSGVCDAWDVRVWRGSLRVHLSPRPVQRPPHQPPRLGAAQATHRHGGNAPAIEKVHNVKFRISDPLGIYKDT